MHAIVRWLNPSSWPTLLVFVMLGVFGGLFAWFSYNLIHPFMANFRFISEHGWLALQVGGLRQAIELVSSGYLAIAAYVAFRVCEVELVGRLRNGSGSVNQPADPADI
jgi:H+/Cl- antiporter ClcA